MEQQLDTLEPGTLRHDVLSTAISFKRSWLALAQRMTEVQRGDEFKTWGYRTFEAYAQHELHLKKETALKLLRSYDFLSTYEPRLVDPGKKNDEPPPLPSFESIDVLAAARNNPYLSERDYRELRDQVFRDDLTPSQVKKALRERAPDPVAPESPSGIERLRKSLALAERLYGLIVEDETMPERISNSMEEVVGGLRQLLGE